MEGGCHGRRGFVRPVGYSLGPATTQSPPLLHTAPYAPPASTQSPLYCILLHSGWCTGAKLYHSPPPQNASYTPELRRDGRRAPPPRNAPILVIQVQQCPREGTQPQILQHQALYALGLTLLCGWRGGQGSGVWV